MARNYSDFTGDKNPNYKTGYASKEGRSKKSPYNSWTNMKSRCNNPKHPKYYRYGGRGIKVCEEFRTASGFIKWALKNGWSAGLSIDRVDNDGDYTPNNCKWISVSENSRKKSTTKISLEEAGEIRDRIALGEDEYVLAEEYGVVHGTIWFIKNNITHKHTAEGN